MAALLQDLKYGVRTLARSHRFTLLTLATLAVSIGATTALFSVVNGVLLRPLPYPEADKLFQVWATDPEQASNGQSPGDYLDLKSRVSSFKRVAGYETRFFELAGKGEPQRLRGAEVTPDFFEVFGVRAEVGRTFETRQDRPGSGRRVVLGNALWQRSFDANPRLPGEMIRVDGESVTVAGILPPSFDWPPGAQLWTLATQPVPTPPIAVPGDLVANRDLQYFDAVARLAPGANRRSAGTELAALARDLELRFPQSNRGRGWRLVPLKEQLVGDIRRPLAVLLGAVAFVWLVACANIATLMLARVAGRQREMAIRAALGAGQARLVRQLLTESLLLALAAGGAGLLLASWGTDLLLRLAPSEIPRLSQVSLDGRAALVAVALSLAAGVLFGLAPALLASRRALARVLQGGARTTGGTRRRSLRMALVVAELALALTLLSGAGLLANSFFRLRRVDPGFPRLGQLAVRLPLPQTRYPDAPRQTQFYAELLRRLRASPELASAAAVFPMPFWGDGATANATPAEQSPGIDGPIAQILSISPGYFQALGAPLRSGRDFDSRDRAGAPPTAIVSASLARRLWASKDPVSRSLRIGSGAEAVTATVVGVAPDIRLRRLGDTPPPAIYLPMEQFMLPLLSLVVRGRAGSEQTAAAVRREVHGLDPLLPIDEARPVHRLVEDSVAHPRFRTALLAAFAAAALALATLGVYGIVSATVAERTREFGVRIALGAGPGHVRRVVLGEGLRLALLGIGLGIGGAFAVTRVLKSLLFGVGATDLPTLAAVSLLLWGAALLASFLPARRATKVDPVVAMRTD